MKRIGAFEAKNRLSELLEAAENGEEIMITKHGRPVAKLMPVDEIDRAKVHEAIEWLKNFRRKHPLRGVTFRELIDGGRKY